jgi:hypothetical protein
MRYEDIQIESVYFCSSVIGGSSNHISYLKKIGLCFASFVTFTIFLTTFIVGVGSLDSNFNDPSCDQSLSCFFFFVFFFFFFQCSLH